MTEILSYRGPLPLSLPVVDLNVDLPSLRLLLELCPHYRQLQLPYLRDFYDDFLLLLMPLLLLLLATHKATGLVILWGSWVLLYIHGGGGVLLLLLFLGLAALELREN